MGTAKKKSSGWRPADKRRTPKEWQARQVTADTAKLRRDCDRFRLWRTCPVGLCRRVHGCTGDPLPCKEERQPNIPEKRNGDTRAEAANRAAAATGNDEPRFAQSAAEAAAAIAASIAGYEPPAPLHGEELEAEELEAIVRDGRIHYEPRRR
jgi:hypothetical protein